VADIGAGTGYFTFPVARAVGPTGTVLALDIAPEMIEVLEFRVQAQKTANITVKQVPPTTRSWRPPVSTRS